MTRATGFRSRAARTGVGSRSKIPARSLFLLKAVKAVPHKGDKRFEVNSPEYKAIADWIAAGAPGPKADDPRIVSLSVSEPHLVTQAGKSVPLKVTAKFSDGHSEDVTRWCKYNATNASVATVDDSGLIKTTGSRRGTVSAWYLSLLERHHRHRAATRQTRRRRLRGP
jgi:hypothetical protein